MKPILLTVALLTGCTTTTTTIRVPVPVKCKEQVPDRPVMPTEQFTTRPPLDAWIQAAMAELLRREAYETTMRTALVACTAPVTTGAGP